MRPEGGDKIREVVDFTKEKNQKPPV